MKQRKKRIQNKAQEEENKLKLKTETREKWNHKRNEITREFKKIWGKKGTRKPRMSKKETKKAINKRMLKRWRWVNNKRKEI